MKSKQPTIIELDARVLDKARGMRTGGKGIKARTFGVLHAIIDLWNEQRRPLQFKLTYAEVAAILDETEQVICEEMTALRNHGLLVRIRHGNQYSKSVWQFHPALCETSTMTPKEVEQELRTHKTQRAAQVEKQSGPPPVSSPTPTPAFDHAPEQPGLLAGLDALLNKWESMQTAPTANVLQDATPDMQNVSISNTTNSKKCNSPISTCTPAATYYSNTEFKSKTETSFPSRGTDRREIVTFNEMNETERPFVVQPDRAAFGVFDHKRYWKAKFNLDSPYYPKPFEDRQPGKPATWRNTFVDLNNEPKDWADTQMGIDTAGMVWAWCMGLNPHEVFLDWRDLFVVKQTSCKNRTAFFKHHCLQNYDRLRMREETMRVGTWHQFGGIIRLD